MDIICDTHIWYSLGNGHIDPNVVSENDRLIASYNNIDEFCRTHNLVTIPEQTRNAIRSMFKFSRSHAIFEPPLVYLKKLDNPDYEYNVAEKHNSILSFTEKIAKGHEIEASKSDEYLKMCDDRKAELRSVSDLVNEDAKRIKSNIKNKERHRNENSIPINRQLISSFVSTISGDGGLSSNFDWSKIELFENTLKVFFNSLETGAMSVTPNDWYDLFLLIYVQPDRKVWTRENKWIELIKKAGMEAYLYSK